jgi:hypothetical protein
MENVRGTQGSRFSRYQFFMAVSALSLFCQPSSRADSLIDVCDQASLSVAVAAGGTITFDCGSDPLAAISNE